MIAINHVRWSVSEFEAAVRGMRNPMNSWALSDSKFDVDSNTFKIGDKDLNLMRKLYKAGSEHRKFMRYIYVTMDITAPLYWWKEMDTYKFSETNSCSTMHKLMSKPFTLDDFSIEHLDDDEREFFKEIVVRLNTNRSLYISEDDKKLKNSWWWNNVQLLPSSYNQKRTVILNYETLSNIYHQRCNHKLDEWHTLCDVIMMLPYMRDICLEKM